MMAEHLSHLPNDGEGLDVGGVANEAALATAWRSESSGESIKRDLDLPNALFLPDGAAEVPGLDPALTEVERSILLLLRPGGAATEVLASPAPHKRECSFKYLSVCSRAVVSGMGDLAVGLIGNAAPSAL